MCGGTVSPSTTLSMIAGLSPRVRGNLHVHVHRRAPIQSIPACAGEPCLGVPQFWHIMVYPRVCGGTSVSAVETSALSGLSPRVRGNHLPLHVDRNQVGSIPACAGEPRMPHITAVQHRVYPRVCGGTRRPERRLGMSTGLSPRVRGNQGLTKHPVTELRSIPACAGEPRIRRLEVKEHQVYPRVCGGTMPTSSGISGSLGLSPRVRGNLGNRNGREGRCGSIPACAGEPVLSQSTHEYSQVYPRVCGGTELYGGCGSDAGGLSPRVRGNLSMKASRCLRRVSIPACAGEPPDDALSRKPGTVYPRVCGGTTRPIQMLPCWNGLSPRVRGNPNDAVTEAA